MSKCYNHLMIKAIITDVDGVIVGKKKGVNYPLPNNIIIKRLSELHNKGIPVVLCTAKFGHAIYEIIRQADLRNPHITEGGAVIIDLLSNKIISTHSFEKQLIKNITSHLLKDDIYTECYGVKDYYIQMSQKNSFTDKRTEFLQRAPKAVSSLVDELSDIDVVKVVTFFEQDKVGSLAKSLEDNFGDNIHIILSPHPEFLPYTPAVITIKGVSKKSASLEVLKSLGISPDEALGVGDNPADWIFMSICKYVATAGENPELKSYAKKKGEGNYFFGPAADENGFLDILNYFKL